MSNARAIAFLLLSLIAAAPGLGAAPTAQPAPAQPAPAGSSARYHVLATGETIYSIARKYGLPPDAIVRANGIDDPSKIRAGQRLIIPSLHKVQKGETLYGIARLYGVTVDELREANKLKPQATIRAGDSLIVPGAKPAAAAAPPPAPKPAAAPVQKAPAVQPPPLPAVVKTQGRTVDATVSWPCPGEPVYLDDKTRGVLIRTRLGEPQKAVAAGKVVAAGPFRGYGEMVIVMSRTGYLYVYAGNRSLSVAMGDTVRSGQELGQVGLDAKEGAAMAFFMVYKGREVVDPALAPRD